MEGDAAESVAARLRSIFAARDLTAFRDLLDPAVRWGPQEETPETCHTRDEVLARYTRLLDSGVLTDLLEASPGEDAVLLGTRMRWRLGQGSSRVRDVYQVLKLRDGLIVDIRGYPSHLAAAAQAGLAVVDHSQEVEFRQVIPELRVSDLQRSIEWFEALGWSTRWTWCEPDATPTFCSMFANRAEIFLTLDRHGVHEGTSLWIEVSDVDALHERCVQRGVEVVRPPRDEPWGQREMLVRHTDGHALRLAQPIHHH
jgi:predicted enzyme related to lactoylglutathione lyase/ketosteroid isomerase-like protein